MSLKVLGLNSEGHDTSACITIDGKLIAACEQERYDKIKHSRNFPLEAIKDCLKISKLSINDIDVISSGFDPQILIRDLYLKPSIENYDRLSSCSDFLIGVRKGDELSQNLLIQYCQSFIENIQFIEN